METRDSIEPFADTFEKAREMGLRTVAHAGEFGPPESIRQTLDILKPSRIGHGLSAVRDGRLMKRLIEIDVPLEISPSSNIQLKAVTALHEHPVKILFDNGVPLVINTDDPAFFKTTLTEEYLLLKTLNFSDSAIHALIQDSFRYAFLEDHLPMN